MKPVGEPLYTVGTQVKHPYRPRRIAGPVSSVWWDGQTWRYEVEFTDWRWSVSEAEIKIPPASKIKKR